MKRLICRIFGHCTNIVQHSGYMCWAYCKRCGDESRRSMNTPNYAFIWVGIVASAAIVAAAAILFVRFSLGV
jgi:hypothetical protein